MACCDKNNPQISTRCSRCFRSTFCLDDTHTNTLSCHGWWNVILLFPLFFTTGDQMTGHDISLGDSEAGGCPQNPGTDRWCWWVSMTLLMMLVSVPVAESAPLQCDRFLHPRWLSLHEMCTQNLSASMRLWRPASVYPPRSLSAKKETDPGSLISLLLTVVI